MGKYRILLNTDTVLLIYCNVKALVQCACQKCSNNQSFIEPPENEVSPEKMCLYEADG